MQRSRTFDRIFGGNVEVQRAPSCSPVPSPRELCKDKPLVSRSVLRNGDLLGSPAGKKLISPRGTERESLREDFGKGFMRGKSFKVQARASVVKDLIKGTGEATAAQVRDQQTLNKTSTTYEQKLPVRHTVGAVMGPPGIFSQSAGGDSIYVALSNGSRISQPLAAAHVSRCESPRKQEYQVTGDAVLGDNGSNDDGPSALRDMVLKRFSESVRESGPRQASKECRSPRGSPRSPGGSPRAKDDLFRDEGDDTNAGPKMSRSPSNEANPCLKAGRTAPPRSLYVSWSKRGSLRTTAKTPPSRYRSASNLPRFSSSPTRPLSTTTEDDANIAYASRGYLKPSQSPRGFVDERGAPGAELTPNLEPLPIQVSSLPLTITTLPRSGCDPSGFSHQAGDEVIPASHDEVFSPDRVPRSRSQGDFPISPQRTPLHGKNSMPWSPCGSGGSASKESGKKDNSSLSPVLAKRSVWSRLDNSLKDEYHVQSNDDDNDVVVLTLKSQRQPRDTPTLADASRPSRESKPMRWSLQSSTQISAAERRHYSPPTREVMSGAPIFDLPERKHFGTAQGQREVSPEVKYGPSELDVHVLSTAESMCQRPHGRHKQNWQTESSDTKQVRSRDFVHQKSKAITQQRWR